MVLLNNQMEFLWQPKRKSDAQLPLSPTLPVYSPLPACMSVCVCVCWAPCFITCLWKHELSLIAQNVSSGSQYDSSSSFAHNHPFPWQEERLGGKKSSPLEKLGRKSVCTYNAIPLYICWNHYDFKLFVFLTVQRDADNTDKINSNGWGYWYILPWVVVLLPNNNIKCKHV